MSEKKNYSVLAYYHFTSIADPHEEVRTHKTFLEDRDVSCRIYISEEGINGQMSAYHEDADAYMDWMRKRPGFENLQFKTHSYHENVFPRITVKYRKQLVALDTECDLSDRGEYVSPERWKEMLESDSDRVLIDVRNDYEWQLGHFAGADLPPCKTFRDFADYADKLKEKADPGKTPVMMYCTGGIRCELYSAILKEKGFEKVYQLEGGIIGYGLQQGSEHWLGKLFVFDDRLSIPISEKDPSSPVIGKCRHCDTPNDQYYNCANMDCNDLFLCCQACLNKFLGCCCSDCEKAPRRRPFHEQNPHKPFRRWYHYENHLPPEAVKHKKGVKHQTSIENSSNTP